MAQIREQCEFGELRIREHPLEAAAVRQGTDISVHIDQIEARELEIGTVDSCQLAGRRVVEHQENVDPSLNRDPVQEVLERAEEEHLVVGMNVVLPSPRVADGHRFIAASISSAVYGRQPVRTSAPPPVTTSMSSR